MNPRSLIVQGLLVAALGIAGCAARVPATTDAGWVTLIDGASGVANFDLVGDANWRGLDGAVQAVKAL